MAVELWRILECSFESVFTFKSNNVSPEKESFHHNSIKIYSYLSRIQGTLNFVEVNGQTLFLWKVGRPEEELGLTVF